MNNRGTLILTRPEIADLMNFSDYVVAVENAFLVHASGKIRSGGVMDIGATAGTFHVKGAGMPVEGRDYVAVKVNGNFPDNQARFRLPTIQGAILLFDGERGNPLAILDSTEITMNRTGAATAIAAKHLARKTSKIAMIFGCGMQGMIQAIALKNALHLEEIFVFDINTGLAKKFSEEMTRKLEMPVHAVAHLEEVVQADVIITCTTSRKYFLKREHVSPGCFIAAVGADSHDKQELDPALLASGKVVTDVADQCARIGEFHHAIESGLMSRDDVYAELSEVVAGQKAGRTSDAEIIVFDSTGTAIQDVASAAIAYERAVQQEIGQLVNLAS